MRTGTARLSSPRSGSNVPHGNRRPLRDRFFDHVSAEPNTGCWLWLGAVSRLGYGSIWSEAYPSKNGRHVPAHRVSYELHKGPIPEGLTIDHLCRVRGCVNPDHLEAVTLRENILRGENPAALNARKTHCAQGHEFSADNTRHGKFERERVCRQCARIRIRLWMRRARQLKRASRTGRPY